MANPVVAIGLDAPNVDLLEKWMAAGYLPTLTRLREKGSYAQLRNFASFRAETPWTTFLTSRSPASTGYYGPIKYRKDAYQIEYVNAFHFGGHPIFYELGDDSRVCVFDVPQTQLSDKVSGAQVLAWGAHSPQTPSCSKPAALLGELTQRHGSNSLLRNDVRSVYDPRALEMLRDDLILGIGRKAKICVDLLEREPWDLFVTVFGEPHTAAHSLWHVSESDHPLHGLIAPQINGNPMLEVHQSIDSAIAETLEAAPDNATVVIFATHGTALNVHDLPSIVFLPEFLYRYNFPGRSAVAPGPHGAKPGALFDPDYASKTGFATAVWRETEEGGALNTFLKRRIPEPVYRRLAKYVSASNPHDIDSPFELRRRGQVEPFQITTWYRKFWPQMKAFALPSYSEGYVRINLKGRDPSGIVEPGDYEKVRDDLADSIRRMIDARTGNSMVKDVIFTRETASDDRPGLPDADIVIIWQEASAADVVDSPDVGMIGPLPFLRSASHREKGFFLCQGEGVARGKDLAECRGIDLAPTILSRMHQEIPSCFEGEDILARGE